MKIRAVFFDMFNTLADPHEYLEHTESDILGMEPSEWNSYVWREDIAKDRGLGVIKTEDELMDRICAVLPFALSMEQREAVKAAHRERLRKCMTEIPEDVLKTVKALKEKGFLLGIISNADITDNASWEESPLYPLFDDAVFSCDVGMVKPNRDIYELALERLGVSPKEAVFVGDGGSSEHRGAKALGMTTIWTEHLKEWDGGTREEISEYADHHVKDFSEIESILKGLILSDEVVSDIQRYMDKRRHKIPKLMSDNTVLPESSEYIPETYARLDFVRPKPSVPMGSHAVTGGVPEDIEEMIRNKEESFQKHLFRLIDRKGLEDPEVYKRANIDRRLFSKIRKNEDYKPSKSTAVAFAIALKLNLDETLDLLGRASITLSNSDDFDMIIRYCITHRIWNIIEVNYILERYGQPLLGA